MSDTVVNSDFSLLKLKEQDFKNKLSLKVQELNQIYSEAQSIGLRMNLEQRDDSTCRFFEFKAEYSVTI
ncbi:MAG: hypothetical protein R2783_08425 [Gelidibacter sp.]